MRSVLILLLLGPIVGIAIFWQKETRIWDWKRASSVAKNNNQRNGLETFVLFERNKAFIEEIEELRTKVPTAYRNALANAVTVDKSITPEMSVNQVLDRLKKNPFKGVEGVRHLIWATQSAQIAAKWSAE